jgi:hypothetical protein
VTAIRFSDQCTQVVGRLHEVDAYAGVTAAAASSPYSLASRDKNLHANEPQIMLYNACGRDEDETWSRLALLTGRLEPNRQIFLDSSDVRAAMWNVK